MKNNIGLILFDK